MATAVIQQLFVLALHAVVVWPQLEDLLMTKSCHKGLSVMHFNANTTTANFSVYNNKECGISLSDVRCYKVDEPMYFAVTSSDTSIDSIVSKHVVANISWKLERDDAVPEIFLLLVKHLLVHPSIGTCVFFNSSILGQNSNEMHKHFHFDCLSPINGVLVEVLGYTVRWSQRQCPQEVRRNLCMQLSHQCSQNQIYLLSQAKSRKQICSCHKDLSMQMLTSYTSEGTFKVASNNLPPFLERLLIEIVDKLNASNNYKKEVRAPIDENFTFLTDQKFGAGNYSIHLRTYCGRENDIQERCGDGILHLMSFEHVPQSNDPRLQAQPYETMLSVMASVIACGIVTVVIFCALQVYRKYYRHSHQFLHEDEVNNRNNENSNLYDQEYLQEQQPLNRQTTENVEIEDKMTISMSGEKNNITLKLMSHHFSMLQYYHDQPNNQRTWMLVYHSDNMDHKRKIDTICRELTQHQLKFSCGNSVNWPDFAELAAKEFRDIIMVVSEGLCKLCHDYMLRIQSNNEILKQRNFEIIPCVVMNKLRCLVHEDPERTDFMLHIVSVEQDAKKGKALVEQFLNDHSFIKTTKNYHVYQWDVPV